MSRIAWERRCCLGISFVYVCLKFWYPAQDEVPKDFGAGAFRASSNQVQEHCKHLQMGQCFHGSSSGQVWITLAGETPAPMAMVLIYRL